MSFAAAALCKNFIGYTFAHLAGATAVTAAGAELGVIPNTLVALVLTVIGIFILLFVLMAMSPSPVKYLLFAVFTFLLGSLSAPMVGRLKQKGLLRDVLVTTAGIFVGMALLGFADRQNMLGFGPYLLAGLAGLVIAQLVLIVLEATGKLDKNDEKVIRKPLLWFGLAIFTLLVGFDVQILKRNAKACSGRPDYINESMGLYLDLINIFSNLGDLFSD